MSKTVSVSVSQEENKDPNAAKKFQSVSKEQRQRAGGYMINCDSNMEMMDPRKGFVLSTDDPVPEEEKKEEPIQ